MTGHFAFRLQQPVDPLRPFVQILTRVVIPNGEDEGVLIDDIRSEKEIDETINILIGELKETGDQAKKEFTERISMSKK